MPKPALELEVILERKRIYDELSSQEKAAEALGISRRTMRDTLSKYKELDEQGKIPVEKPLYKGRVDAFKRRVLPVPKRGKVTRYILTCAQNNTPVHPEVWQNLVALADHYNCRDNLLVSCFMYNHNAFGELSVKPGTKKHQSGLWFDPAVLDHISDESVEIAPSLVWCGELNILPTAVRPLSGLEQYTGRKSAIVPHAKFSMESVASGKSEATKFNYTTGTVTQRNYIQKKAGLKAEFHHGYGALLVEVDSDGDWFVRQLNADTSGTIYDLNLCVKEGVVTSGHSIEGITWGDIHVDQIDEEVKQVCWSKGGMLDQLRPRYQFFHDVLDFKPRNHHDRGNCHLAFEKYIEGRESVEEEVERVKMFLDYADRDWCLPVVVDSNHDNAMKRWLKEGDYKNDPINAVYFLQAQLEVYLSIQRKDPDFHLVEWALQCMGCDPRVKFLREDESFIICPDSSGGIECGMHGHLGPNGARGGPQSLKKMGRKANIGHSHSAGIYDGLYQAGTTSSLDLGYNSGPSSWSHSHIITYPNGKRSLITIWNKKWRAL